MRLQKHKKIKQPVGGAQPFRLPVLTCIRCGHAWHTKTNRRPIRCAKCKSPYWDREREMSQVVVLEDADRTLVESAENEGLAVQADTEEVTIDKGEPQ